MNKFTNKLVKKLQEPLMVHKIGTAVGAVVGFLAATYVVAKTEPMGDL